MLPYFRIIKSYLTYKKERFAMSSMQPLECPYCGHYIRDIYTPKYNLEGCYNCYCDECHKPFEWEVWQGELCTHTDSSYENVDVIPLECPHCGQDSGKYGSIPRNYTTPLEIGFCLKCRKYFHWKGDHGKFTAYPNNWLP